MAVHLGLRPAGAGAVELLLECHQRSRQVAALMRRLAAGEGATLGSLAADAESVRRYLSETLPLHVADEEWSVVPLLRGRDPALDGALAVMRREHESHGPRVVRVVGLCADLAAAPERHPLLAPRLAEAAESLDRHFAPHLALEEETIYPALKRILDPATDARLVAEMRARRSGDRSGR